MEKVKNKIKADIPNGLLCYNHVEKNLCKYWRIDRNKPEGKNGYCQYLDKGDWENNKHKHDEFVKIKLKKRNPHLTLNLLCEMYKECGINLGNSDED